MAAEALPVEEAVQPPPQAEQRETEQPIDLAAVQKYLQTEFSGGAGGTTDTQTNMQKMLQGIESGNPTAADLQLAILCIQSKTDNAKNFPSENDAPNLVENLAKMKVVLEAQLKQVKAAPSETAPTDEAARPTEEKSQEKAPDRPAIPEQFTDQLILPDEYAFSQYQLIDQEMLHIPDSPETTPIKQMWNKWSATSRREKVSYMVSPALTSNDFQPDLAATKAFLLSRPDAARLQPLINTIDKQLFRQELYGALMGRVGKETTDSHGAHYRDEYTLREFVRKHGLEKSKQLDAQLKGRTEKYLAKKDQLTAAIALVELQANGQTPELTPDEKAQQEKYKDVPLKTWQLPGYQQEFADQRRELYKQQEDWNPEWGIEKLRQRERDLAERLGKPIDVYLEEKTIAALGSKDPEILRLYNLIQERANDPTYVFYDPDYLQTNPTAEWDFPNGAIGEDGLYKSEIDQLESYSQKNPEKLAKHAQYHPQLRDRAIDMAMGKRLEAKAPPTYTPTYYPSRPQREVFENMLANQYAVASSRPIYQAPRAEQIFPRPANPSRNKYAEAADPYDDQDLQPERGAGRSAAQIATYRESPEGAARLDKYDETLRGRDGDTSLGMALDNIDINDHMKKNLNNISQLDSYVVGLKNGTIHFPLIRTRDSQIPPLLVEAVNEYTRLAEVNHWNIPENVQKASDILAANEDKKSGNTFSNIFNRFRKWLK